MTSTTLNPAAPAAAPVQSPPRWRHGHWVALAVIALGQAFVRVLDPLASDMLWGARFGWDVLSSGQLPATDNWSWTASGHEFVANSWAWNVVFGISYHAAGVYGFWLLTAAMSVALALTVGRTAQHYGVAPLPLLAVYGVVGALAVETLPRAQVLSNLAVVLVPVLALGLLRADGRRAVLIALARLGLFEAVWMNLHEGALIGPLLFGGACLAIAVASRRAHPLRQGAARGAAAVVVSGIACLATPYGLSGVTHSFEVRAASVGLINEWQPAGFATGQALVGLGGALAGALLAVPAWRRGRPGVAACLVLLAVAALTAIRFVPELAVVAIPELAALLQAVRVRKVMWARIAVAGVLVCATQAALDWRDPGSLGPASSPGLVQALPQGCRLLNDDLVGDAVILLRPDVRVALDGRNDVYGRATLLQLTSVFAGGAPGLRWLARRQVTCVLAPTAEPLVQQLARQRGWHVSGTDATRTLLVRS